MKLRTFYVLCYSCALCALAVASEGSEWNLDSEWKDGKASSSSESREAQEASAISISNSTRDKRGLGLILSGLAQVFGYTVSPVQVASLPNGNPQPNTGTSQQPATPMNATQSTPSTTAAPRQKETIRFTGVLNFGNSTGLLTHLQQYERLFHGNNSNGAPGSTATPSTAAPPDPSMMNSRPASPFLVNIPLPSMKQPPLPEIPPQNISLSYPRPLIPIQNAQGMVFRKNQSTETLTVEDKEIQNAMDVRSSPPLPRPTPYTPFYTPYTEEPRWKKEHEERLAELERKQQEHAEKLRQQEQQGNRVRDGDYGSQGVRKDHKEEDSECREEKNENYDTNDSAEEEEDSGEKYESPGRVPLSQSAKESQGSGEDEKYRDYEDDDGNYKSRKQYDDAPQTDDNYTNVKYDEPLPISEDDEQRRPEELKNSYGEPLNSRDLVEDRFVGYFGKFKDSPGDFHDSGAPNSREDSKQKDWHQGEDEDASDEKGRRDDLPATTKYEEYSLEEETDARRKEEQNSNEDASDPFTKYPNKASFDSENGPSFGRQGSREEVDFSSYMPLVVPFRYVNSPEEMKETKSRLSTTENSQKIDNMANTESTKKISSKESRIGKKESLKPKIGIPERPMLKKLHEGEQKELQMWPPPFDFVLDSTIQTGVTTKPAIAKSFIPRKPEVGEEVGEEEGESPRQNGKRRFINAAQRQRDFLDNAYYQRFKEDPELRRSASKQTPGPSKLTNSEDTKPRLQQRKNAPDFWKRYKYSLNDNLKSVDPKLDEGFQTRPDSTQNPSSTQSKRFESLKRSAEKMEPDVGSYYIEGHPRGHPEGHSGGSESKSDVGRGFGLTLRKSIPPTSFHGPMDVYGLSNFGKMDYGLNYEGGMGNQNIETVKVTK